MKRILMLLLLTFCLLALFAQTPPPEYYHRYDQIKAVLDSIVTVAPNYARVDSIGYSQVNHTPLWAIKLSNNVSVDRDVPRVLFIGDIHSEEIIGQELILSNIKEIIQRRNIQPYLNWMNNLEMWFIPCMNPDGLEVVMSGVDLTYRKNKRDTDNDGILDFIEGQGNDRDGVDLNRNFGSHWIHGDSLFAPSGYEVFDYYRGNAPFSESETQAIKRFMEKYQFVYSVVWHSSRTGNLSEKVYPPFNWKYVRPAPDLDINNNIGQNFASKILTQSGSGYYECAPSLGRNGASNMWAYLAMGNIQLVIECGTHDIQPSQAMLNNTITRCTEAVKWLLNRAVPAGSETMDRSMLTGKITDASTGLPLVAEIAVLGRDSKQLSPRLSNPQYGRYWRPLLAGNYTITVKKKGYESQTISNITVNAGGWKTVNVNLVPLPVYQVTGHVKLNGQNVNAQVVISDITNDTLYCEDGIFNTSLSQGEHTFTIFTTDLFTYTKTINIDSPKSLNFNISSATSLFSETFNNLTTTWETVGPWAIRSNNGISYLTDSPNGYGFYAVDCDVWVKTAVPINLSASETEDINLVLNQRIYTEWEHDFVRVEVSTDNNTWTELYRQDGEYYYWHNIAINLNAYRNQSVYFRFRLKDGLDGDTNYIELNDLGWDISEIKITRSTPEFVPVDNPTMNLPIIKLKGNYPNPFNPETRIAFNISNLEVKNAKIDIFNIKGQKVSTLDLNENDISNGYKTWNNNKCSSGVYFYSLSVNGKSYGVKKAVMLK